MYPDFTVVKMPKDMCLRIDEILYNAPCLLLKSYNLSGGETHTLITGGGACLTLRGVAGA